MNCTVCGAAEEHFTGEECVETLKSKLDRALKMLDELECADCMGTGEIPNTVERVVPECCGRPRNDGSCCGNAVPGIVQDFVTEPCPWCAERDAIRGRIVEIPDPLAQKDHGIAQAALEPQTCNHCGSPVPCGCWPRV